MLQMTDLQAQYRLLKQPIDQAIAAVLAHGGYIMGPEVAELERQLADHCEVAYAITMSSGTDALVAALMALDIGAGAEVITTPFSFIATAEAIALVGARPVFVDIEPRSFNIDVARIADAITAQTRAIMPVSLYGQCADMDGINALAAQHGLAVIEDAAQSFGARHHGRASGALSTIGCTSFYPSKPLGCYGDGGACFTADADVAERLRQIRDHGSSARYLHARVGLNARLDTLQAAVLLAKLPILPQELAQRRVLAARYAELLSPLHTLVTRPWIAPHNLSVFAQYTIEIDRRDPIQAELHRRGVPSAVHYPRPLHLQPAFAGLGYRAGAFPYAERASERVLSLPLHPYLSTADQILICDALVAALQTA